MTEVTLLFDWRANCSEPSMEYVKCSLTTTIGLASSICNGMIVLTIANEKIRCSKELLIVVALAFTDFIEAFATFLGGVQCFVGHAFIGLQMSSIQCMMLPQYWMWRWSDFATAFMTLSVNADRLFFLLTPIRYTSWTIKYSHLIITTVYTVSLFGSFFAWIYPISDNHIQSFLCTEVIDDTFYKVSKYLTGGVTALSVALYIPVLYLLRQHKLKIANNLCQAQLYVQRQSQLRVTTTIALSGFMTIFLDALPRIIGIYFTTNQPDGTNECDLWFSYLFLLTKVNSAINLPLYYVRCQPIREAIQNLRKCKFQ